MYNTSKFESKLFQLGIKLSGAQIQQFIRYYEILTEKNKVMNLTAITEFDEVIDKHFVDSLSLVKAVDLNQDMNKELTVIDVGTGAGFPGIPLKIAFPRLEIVLLDSLNKRISFLNDVIQDLHLEGINAYHGRAEDYGRNVSFREQFDLCVSRAVANMSTLSEYCMPFVKVGGQFIPYKSGSISEELKQAQKAVKLLGGCLDHTETYILPDTDIERTLVVINKKEKTKKTYPRKAGKPAKEPLGCSMGTSDHNN